MTYNEIKKNKAIHNYIKAADDSLIALGFTEHSFAHVTIVAEKAGYILETLGYDSRTVELVKIAGYLHDIGNLVNRIAFRILDKLGFPSEEIADVVTAIGNHDEGTGVPVSEFAAALILADKSDVRRNRVRNIDENKFDIHDRVNYSVTSADLIISDDKKLITLTLAIDTEYSSVMEYFEIFMARMLLCKAAAEKLGLKFKLVINNQTLL